MKIIDDTALDGIIKTINAAIESVCELEKQSGDYYALQGPGRLIVHDVGRSIDGLMQATEWLLRAKKRQEASQ